MIDPLLAAVLQAVLIGAALLLAVFGGGGSSDERRRRPRPENNDDDTPPPPPPPPSLPGLPILGNCVALARGGAAVLLAARRKGYGDCFAVRAFPFAPPLVFVFHPSAVARFFAAPEDVLSFKPAVRQFTERVFGLPADEFSSSHEPLLDALRALLSPPEKLRAHAAVIARRAAPMLDEWAASSPSSSSFDLWPRARTLVFRAAGGALFGEPFFARHGADRLLSLFLDFEGAFERAASPVPHLLLPRFVKARSALLAALAESLEAGDLQGTVAGDLASRSGVRIGLQPNLLLSVMWASQANSMPAFFWALALLLCPENAAWLERVRESARVEEQGEGEGEAASEEAAAIDAALDPSGPAQRVANEAIRARAHSIAIRLVPPRGGGFDVPVDEEQELEEKGRAGHKRGGTPPALPSPSLRRAPPGCVLAVCPFETHSDPRFFSPKPEAFDPLRPPTGALPGGGGVGMGFGGGFWRCPGRLFAGMELGLLLTMAVTRMELRLVDGAEGKGEEEEAKAPPHATSLLRGWERAAVALLGARRAMFGLGVGLDDYRTACPAASFTPPLPAPDLSRLVGFKVPSGACVVTAAARRRRRGVARS
jgi:cytochrome P450